MASRLKNVMIMISRSDSFGTNLIVGIIEYSKLCGDWALTTDLPPYLEKQQQSQSPYSLQSAGFDGVIAYIPNKDKANMINFDIPAVIAHETDEAKVHSLPYIVCDNREIGKLAALFFKEKGFTNIGFLGFVEFQWSIERQKSFKNANEEIGLATNTFLLSASVFNSKTDNQQQIITWFTELKKPAAILCANDDLGLYLIRLCKNAGIKVPDQIAILGVDNNEIDCNLTTPSLSSISYNSQKAGLQAAEILNKLIDGKKISQKKILISPVEVINRMSTDIFAIADSDVLEAIKFIKINSRNPIQVDDVAVAVNISRRNLSRKFMKALGRSISSEIKRANIEDICHMLTDTNMSVSKIAYRTGFTNASHISRYFKMQTGSTPLEYRDKFSIKKIF